MLAKATRQKFSIRYFDGRTVLTAHTGLGCWQPSTRRRVPNQNQNCSSKGEGEIYAHHCSRFVDRRHRRASSFDRTCSHKLGRTPLAFLGYAATPYIFTVLAIFELISDQLPKTPSRTVPPQFIARIVTGGLSGAAIGASLSSLWIGLVCGVIGAIIGTLGGAAFRGWLASVFGKDLPAALVEDAIAIIGSYLIVSNIG
jgi:uncharacterized membrane protein